MLENPTIDDAAKRDKFRQYLAAKRLRYTHQRQAIFDAAVGASHHFTAEELLGMSREIVSGVSRATVYRTLPILVECSLVKEIDIGKDYKFYAPVREEKPAQAEVFCVDCDRIFEVDAPFLEWYGTTVSAKLGLSVISQRLQVRAHCDDFQTSGQCPRRDKLAGKGLS